MIKALPLERLNVKPESGTEEYWKREKTEMMKMGMNDGIRQKNERNDEECLVRAVATYK